MPYAPCMEIDLEQLRERIRALDPDLLLAVEEVDRSLIALALDKTPLERLAFSEQMLRTLTSFRRVRADGH